LAQYGKDRSLAAKALVRIGQCYEKLGDAESRKIYERVVREYADQKEATAAERAALGGPPRGATKTTRLVFSGPHADDEGTISFDGRFLSYTNWATGDLIVREVASGADLRLTDTKNSGEGMWTTFAERSAISRDGRQVAFSWYDDHNGKRYELRLASVAGDPNVRRLYDNPTVGWLAPRDWSPDGRWVAVLIASADKNEIGVISIPEGKLRVLKTGKWRRNTNMFFSPDGKYLGYDMPESEVGAARDVFIIATDTGQDVPAVVHRGRDLMMGWSPDGKRLLFASDRTGSMGLWSVAFAVGKPQGQPEALKGDLGEVQPLGITRSGTLYYGLRTAAVRSRVQVGSLDFTTGNLISPPHDVATNSQESNEQPVWSPDGKSFAYLSRRGWLNDNNYVVIRSSENLRELRELQPKLLFSQLTGWAPDGRSVVAYGVDKWGGPRGFFRIDANTGDVALLLGDGSDQYGMLQSVSSWDGKVVYVSRRVSDGKETAFFRRDLSSGGETEVIRRRTLGALNLSPDGRYLATWSSDASSNSRLMLLIPTDGGKPHVGLSFPSGVEPAQLDSPATGTTLGGVTWASDSRSFLTIKWFPAAKEPGEMWRVFVDGSEPQKLDVAVGPNTPRSAKPQPGGQQIAWAVNAARSRPAIEVWVLENFLQ
jgi:WD40 repeat protein